MALFIFFHFNLTAHHQFSLQSEKVSELLTNLSSLLFLALVWKGWVKLSDQPLKFSTKHPAKGKFRCIHVHLKLSEAIKWITVESVWGRGLGIMKSKTLGCWQSLQKARLTVLLTLSFLNSSASTSPLLLKNISCNFFSSRHTINSCLHPLYTSFVNNIYSDCYCYSVSYFQVFMFK